MVLTEQEKLYLMGKYNIKENTPAPPKEKKETPSIAEMREKLELKKLEMEIAKLETPNTSTDYIKTLLEQQANHFKDLLEQERRHNELNLRIKELELGKDEPEEFGSSFLMELLPMLPEILKARQQPQNIKEAEEVKPIIPTAQQIAEIKLKVRAGEITEAQFIEDAVKQIPALKGKEELIKQEFFKIKNSTD